MLTWMRTGSCCGWRAVPRPVTGPRMASTSSWARLSGGVVTVGITSYAAEQLGDIVYLELPELGRKLEASKPFGVVEAVKTVSDLFAPLDGEVVIEASVSPTTRVEDDGLATCGSVPTDVGCSAPIAGKLAPASTDSARR